MLVGLDGEVARQFATMLSVGAPPMEALAYFFPDTPTNELGGTLKGWLKDRRVQAEIKALQGGKEWEEMTLDERIRFSVEKNYAEMAYYLYTHNYATLTGPERAKADECRRVLEAKLAGVAGKMGVMEEFFNDIKSGKLKLGRPATIGAAGVMLPPLPA